MTITTTGTKRMQPYNKVSVSLADGEYEFDKSIGVFPTTADIKAENYALVHNLSILGGNASLRADSAISMTQDFNGRNYLDSHKAVIKQGLVIPTPSRFMSHLRNVNQALEGKGVLYDANGNLIEGKKLESYAQRLNHDSWVWLNAGFNRGKGFNHLDLVSVTGLDEKGNPVYSKMPLEDCLADDCYADLESLNSQGLPTKKAKVQKYEAGKTVYFYSPRQDSVAWFDADSVGAYLNCYGRADDCDDWLGVFASAEGASSEQNKGTK